MKKTITYIIFLILILAVAYLWQANRDNTIDNNTGETETALHDIPEEYKLMINIEFSDQDVRELPYAYMEEQNLFDITQNTVEAYQWAFDYEDYGEMGILIKQIGDNTNGQDNKYWQYEVNDKSPMLSVDNFIPQAGDVITWKFQESEF
jgi:hypothetical protein